MAFSDLVQKRFIDIVKAETGFANAVVKRTPSWCYVQAMPSASEKVHFEIGENQKGGHVCFHNEAHGNSYEWSNGNRALQDSEFSEEWRARRAVIREISSLDCLETVTKKLVGDLLPILKKAYPDRTIDKSPEDDTNLPHSGGVSIIQTIPADRLLRAHLVIPCYQREYCWRPQDVNRLLNDIAAYSTRSATSSSEYHLGTVIVKERENASGYDVIDGQQRLTTLAIWQLLRDRKAHEDKAEAVSPPYLLKEGMKQELTRDGINALRRASQAITDFLGTDDARNIDFSGITLSVIVLGKAMPDDLAYTFFSNSNSTGKRLSDFDLLKTHHLRFIPFEGTAAQAVERWHELEKGDMQEELLHHSLFRLRNWRSGTDFSFEATSNPDTREVYHHFFCDTEESACFSSMQPTQFRFDSILPGGQPFFQYTEHYRRLYASFQAADAIRKLDASLGAHSNGVIRDGIKAIAFLFYCKFGPSYLTEAVYALAFWLSKLRNESRVMCRYINNPDFRETTSLLDRVTTPSQFLDSLLNVSHKYSIENKGETARRYWNALKGFLRELEGVGGFAVPENMRRSSLFDDEKINNAK